MRIAIHENNAGWSERFIQYCRERGIDYDSVNCYCNDIIAQLKDFDVFIWHWSNFNYRNNHFTRQLLYSLDHIGVKIFPDPRTCWHYDDKIGQRYLLEAIKAPLIPTYIFYDKKDALDWTHHTSFPKVFKLSVGAGSANVMLVHTLGQAKSLIRKAFAGGFGSSSKTSAIKQAIWELRRDRNAKAWKYLLKSMGGALLNKQRLDLLPRQKGYVYFQDFIPGNSYDDRILVIGNRALNARRYVRTNDFRASGSGNNKFERELSNLGTIKLAFNISKALKAQSVAYDFLYDKDQNPLLIEISYAFPTHGFDDCPGYWDEELVWHEEPTIPQNYILDDLIASIKTEKR